MRVAEQVDKTLLRLSAGLADDVRDAIRGSINVETVTREFLQTFPAGSTVTRNQARDWAKQHVQLNNRAMGLVLDQLHSVGYVLGIDYSSAAYSHVVNGLRKAVDADPATFALGFDWSTWKPGNRAAEALVRPPGGLANLLDRNSRSVTIKDIDNTTLDRIGTRLADGLAVGATDTAIASTLRDVVGDPQRALMIAQTEMNRATSAATIDNYNDLGVEQVEWFALDGCELCEGNAEAGPQPIDGEFPSGDSEPPAHPNCRCSLLPWIEGDSVAVRGGGEDVQVDDGVDVVAPAELDVPDGVGVADTTGDVPEPELIETTQADISGFIAGNWAEVSQEERYSQAFYQYKNSYNWRAGVTDDTIRVHMERDKKTMAFVERGTLIQNGNISVRLPATKLPEDIKTELLSNIEKLQATNPKTEMVVSVGTTRRGSYGSAILGNAHINLGSTNTVMRAFQIGSPEAGSFKMPVLAEVSQLQYTLAHEWGHSIDDTITQLGHRNQTFERVTAIKEILADFADQSFISEYAKTSTEELVAEMFAEYRLTNGATTNKVAQAMAERFGWK